MKPSEWPNYPVPEAKAALAQERHTADDAGCWITTYAENKFTGYATISWQDDGKTRSTTVHRASYTHTNGPIPDGMVIDHMCHVRLCVNPAHLRAITLRQNNIRRNNSGAHEFSLDTCQWGHPLSMMKLQPTGKNAGRWHYCQGCLDEKNLWSTTIKKQLRQLEIAYGLGDWHTKGTPYWATLRERNERRAVIRAGQMEEAA